jgi:glycosyltransferase involved in cell wall biosynthesis
MPPIIGFTTRALGGTTGVAHSANDTILALSQAGAMICLRSWRPERLPSEIDGVPMGSWCVHEPPPLTHARAVLLRQAPLASLPARAKRFFSRGWPVEREAMTALEVVNGAGADPIFRHLRPRHAALNILIVRESPRHYSGSARVRETAETMRRYDRLVFVSDVGRNEWIAEAKLDATRTHYVPNCVLEQRAARLTNRREVAARLGYSPGRLHVACVGTIHERKGQDLVLDALAELGPLATSVCVHFIGPLIGEWGRDFAERARRSSVAASCDFAGSVVDPYPHVYAADALVLASRSEAMPRVVLEAMVLGTCVVASDADGMREQIEHGVSGLLFPTGDASALAAHLRNLLEDPETRIALGTAGRARYFERFSRALQITRYAKLLESVLPTSST